MGLKKNFGQSRSKGYTTTDLERGFGETLVGVRKYSSLINKIPVLSGDFIFTDYSDPHEEAGRNGYGPITIRDGIVSRAALFGEILSYEGGLKK